MARKASSSKPRRFFLRSRSLAASDGWVNLARVYQREGRIPEALSALEKAAAHKEPAAPWVINWLTGQINASNNQLEEAVSEFRGGPEYANSRAEIRLRSRFSGHR